MQLTQFTDYSLRSLIYIAVKHELCTITEIATAHRISQNHLTKIIHNLAKLKMIETVRGKNGGVKLAKNPKDIHLKKLILELEPHFDLVPCFNIEKQNCVISPSCQLKHILQEAQKAFFMVLDQYTLADILRNEKDLKKIFTIP